MSDIFYSLLIRVNDGKEMTFRDNATSKCVDAAWAEFFDYLIPHVTKTAFCINAGIHLAKAQAIGQNGIMHPTGGFWLEWTEWNKPFVWKPKSEIH